MVKRITAETGEKCEVDVKSLHKTLLDLPAGKYLELYHMMQNEVLQPFYGGCYPAAVGEASEEEICQRKS